MKNKRAFTLIELLAVIVIMGILLTITIPQLINNLKDKKDVALETIKETIVSIGKNYAIDNNIEAPFYISINDLCTEKYLECPVINPATNSDLVGYVIMDLNNIYYFSYTIPNISNLIVNLNDGQLEQRLLSEYFVGTKLSLNIPTKVGYTFTGWTVEGEGASLSENILTIGTSDTTITANWQRNTVTLTVNLNEGSTTQTFNSSYLPGTTLSLTNPTRSGYEFTGWTVEGTGASISGTELTIGTSDTTITANWEEELTSPVGSYSCANASEGSSPYFFTYTGNCTVIDDGNDNWRVKFLTSGTFIPVSDITIDAFLVGGGGGGSSSGKEVTTRTWIGGAGGGGGYTKTGSVSLEGGMAYTITIGLGGTARLSGEESSAFGFQANGGSGSNNAYGAIGGSGGGAGNSPGGTDGANGSNNAWGPTGGIGSGFTTKEFGEETGTQYSNGGAGGGGASAYSSGACASGNAYNGASGDNNTGNGGGGGGAGCGPSYGSGGSGGSGIVVIRNSKSIVFENTTIGEYTGIYKVITKSDGTWEIDFLTSGIFKPSINMSIDVFLVGGGGGGSSSGKAINSTGWLGGGGGGSGYVTNGKTTVTAGSSYAITIGDRGLSNKDGNPTTAFELSALGGKGSTTSYGGAGGSGGGAAGSSGGTNGASGSNNAWGPTGGTGSGVTTRKFGDSTGDLYAIGGAGGGGASAYSSGACASGKMEDGNMVSSNTGNGGNGASTGCQLKIGRGGAGGSGIVSIRLSK